jgi:polyhydroxyalkanoate synthesis regulator phasin
MDVESEKDPGSDSRWLGIWFDFAAKMMESARGLTAQQTPPEAFRQIRSAQLKAWDNLWQQAVRTPEFLEMVKQGMAMNVQARKQINDFLAQLQHEFQGASRQDVDQLMISMRHVERRVVDGIERIASQLDDLEARLAALEKSPPSSDDEAESDEPPEQSKKRSRKQKPPTAQEADQ